MRLSRPPRGGLRAALAAVIGVVTLAGATVAPVAATVNPGPPGVAALSGFVTDACTGLPITSGLTVGVAAIDPVSMQLGPPRQPPGPPTFGFFRYAALNPGPIALTVSALGYVDLGLAQPPDPIHSAPGVTLMIPPGPVNGLPAGQGLSIGLLLDIRLQPPGPVGGAPGPVCHPPSPNLPAISGRAVDAATGRGLRGLVVGVAPLVADPATATLQPGPVSTPSGSSLLGFFVFPTLSPGPIGSFQFYAAAPGHTSLGQPPDPTQQPPDPTMPLSPGVMVMIPPGPVSGLPAGSGSVTISLVLSVALPAVQ